MNGFLLGIDVVYRFGKNARLIHAGDEDVPDLPVSQISPHRQPEIRAFILESIQSPSFLVVKV
ncbi:MAG: hypothetical protein LBS40_05090 [Burkholderiales bacterium]|jgi:hypothetical protein|nr:hypothetical protein [Burkholderiales bacterium]